MTKPTTSPQEKGKDQSKTPSPSDKAKAQSKVSAADQGAKVKTAADTDPPKEDTLAPQDECKAAGLKLYEKGRYKEAETAFRAALREQPDRGDFSYWLGAALAEQGRPMAAFEASRAAVLAAPREPHFVFQLGMHAQALGWNEMARENYVRAIELDETVAAFKRALKGLPPPAGAFPTKPRILILGHGRSGTTVLMNALNTCTDTFLLGEAHLYRTGDQPYFRDRYNAMHRGFGNQPTKSTYAPVLDGVPAHVDGETYTNALAERVEWVGEKIVLGPESSGHSFERLQAYLERAWDWKMVWALRQPRAIIASCVRRWQGDIDEWAAAVARTMLLFIHTSRILPHVNVVVHEQITATTFDTLGEILGLDFSDAPDVYTESRVAYPDFGRDTASAKRLDRLDAVYETLIAEIDPKTLRLSPAAAQLEQHLPGFPEPDINVLGKVMNELLELAEMPKKSTRV